MYKCSKCGQEMIDKKEYCSKCRNKLFKEKEPIKLKNLLLVFMIMILVGAGICYAIINIGTEDEIKEYLPNKTSAENSINSIE